MQLPEQLARIGLAGMLLFLGLVRAAFGQNYLYNRADYAIGGQLTSVNYTYQRFGLIAADFNGDGRPDVAAVNSGDNTISVLIAQANSSFAAAVTYPVGAAPFGIVAADFNGDGKPDLAVVNNQSNSVSVLLGNGDGTFQPPSSYSVGASPVAIVAADFNHDNKVDLAAANQNDATVSILLGNGDGTFKSQNTFSVSGGPADMAPGDFNNDGKLDLITTSGPFGNAVTVLLGNGDGTFTRKDSMYYISPENLAVGDFNGDGTLDVVLTSYSFSLPQFLAGNGDGTFGPATYIPGLAGPYLVNAADFNGDGKLDVVFTGGILQPAGVGTSFASVYLGNGDGTFTPVPMTSSGAGRALDFVVSDFNGDGHLDLAATAFLYSTVGESQPSLVSVLLGADDGTFDRRSDFPLSSSLTATGPSVVADFNRDGKPDVVVFGTNYSSNSLIAFLGNGDGTLQSPISSPVSVSPSQMLAGDFNNDGNMDLFLIEYETAYLALGNGDGTFQAAAPINVGPTATPTQVAVADFNHDGNLDLFTSYCMSNGNSGVQVFLGNGNGTFNPGLQIPFANGYCGNYTVLVADVNGDGNPDLLFANDYNSFDLALGNGNGTFQSPTVIPSYFYYAPNFAADVNGDGILDLIWAVSPGITVMLGNGNGTFQSQIQTPLVTGIGFNGGAAADFNGDGKADVAVWAGSTYILVSNGDGTFQEPRPYAGEINSLNAGDFNSDGTADLIAVGQQFTLGPQAVSLYLSSPLADYFPSPLSFGSQKVGSSGMPQSVTLANVGNAPLTVTSVASSGDFSEANTCSGTVSVSANCTISVTFTPTTSGLRTASLTITDNVVTSPQTIALTGTGIGPEVALSPASLKFPTQLVGTTSQAQTVTLTNAGNATLYITAIAVSSGFTQTNNCGSSVSARASCTINVTFKPTKAGSVSGGVSITDNARGSPQKVTLTGAGTVVKLVPTQLGFGRVAVGTTSSPMTVTLTNTGKAVLDITGVDFAGNDPKDFGETNTCGSSVGAGKSCTLSVTFTPQASGNRSANLTIKDSGGSPQTVRLSGTGE